MNPTISSPNTKSLITPNRLALAFVLVLIAGSGCQAESSRVNDGMRTGAQVLRDTQFQVLSGKRVGLVTNQTARVDSLHLVDVLHAAPNVQLVALFGPEHGLRGDVEDGAAVTDGIDLETGIPVYSLYGTTRRPTEEMLANVDALVFDIQDVGARFYTFINTMGRSMQAAAKANIPYFVLDRPNPLGGLRVDGYVLDSLHISGVGLYPIPIQHGMTVGELALMIKGEAFLPGLDDLDLHVVRMTGWRRDMLWSDTGAEWRATSPNIPTFETALVYPGTCFFEGTIVSEGRGTDAPFLTIGAPWLDARQAAAELNEMALPGVRFSFEEVQPRAIEGIADNPKFEGEAIQAVTIRISNQASYAPLLNGLAVLSAIYHQAPENVKPDFFRDRWMGLLAGTDRLQRAIETGESPVDIVASWREEVTRFEARREKYLQYD